MSDPPTPILIAGYEQGEAIGRRAASLLGTTNVADRPMLVAWDPPSATWRWCGRRATAGTPVRLGHARAGPRRRHAFPRAARVIELRAHLALRRAADIVMVGREALGAAPRLVSHRGRRIWIPTLDDWPALTAGLDVPPASAGGPHRIVSLDVELASIPALRTDGRHRLCPGFRADAPTASPRLDIVVGGPPERSHGIDLVGRALVGHRDELRARGVGIRWIAPPGATIPVEENADLERSSVDDLISLAPADDVDQELRRRFSTAAAVIGGTRPGSRLSDALLVDAYRQGVRIVGIGADPDPRLGVAGGSTFVTLDDVAGLGDALAEAAALTWSERIHGPVGLRDLIGWAVRDA